MPSYKTFEQLDNLKLKKIHLFSDLNENELDELKSISHLKNFKKGEIIFFDTEPYRGFYCVLKGRVRIYKVSKDGREHTLHFVGERNTFAEVPMFESYEEDSKEEFMYPANAVALEDRTELIFVPKKSFFKIFGENVKIYVKMVSSLSKRLRLLNNHIESLTLQDVSKRIANFLLKEVKQNSALNHDEEMKPVKIDISRTDLASYFGIAVETLSRMLGKFQDDGLITIKGKSIKVNNLSQLIKIAQL